MEEIEGQQALFEVDDPEDGDFGCYLFWNDEETRSADPAPPTDGN